jgi:hypothetical protein
MAWGLSNTVCDCDAVLNVRHLCTCMSAMPPDVCQSWQGLGQQLADCTLSHCLRAGLTWSAGPGCKCGGSRSTCVWHQGFGNTWALGGCRVIEHKLGACGWTAAVVTSLGAAPCHYACHSYSSMHNMKPRAVDTSIDSIRYTQLKSGDQTWHPRQPGRGGEGQRLHQLVMPGWPAVPSVHCGCPGGASARRFIITPNVVQVVK